MKKSVLLCLTLLLVIAPVFAAPSVDDVGDTLEGVMSVYVVTMMGAMFGAQYEGAEMVMDMETGGSTLKCDKFDVTGLFSEESTMGAMMASQGEETPEILFSEMSGDIEATETGDFNIDVVLKGGPVKKLVLEMKNEVVQTFTADGKDFKYLADDPDFMLLDE